MDSFQGLLSDVLPESVGLAVAACWGALKTGIFLESLLVAQRTPLGALRTRWEGGANSGDVCIHAADSTCRAAETDSSVKRLQ